MKRQSDRTSRIFGSFSRNAVGFFVLACLSSASASADPAWCSFTQKQWEAAVSSGDAARIAAARTRATAARHTCPDLYARASAPQAPAKQEKLQSSAKAGSKKAPAPVAAKATPELGAFKLVARLPDDMFGADIFDPVRRRAVVGNFDMLQLLNLENSAVVRSLPNPLLTGTGQSSSHNKAFIKTFGALTAATGRFYATRDNGEVGYCTTLDLTCSWTLARQGDGSGVVLNQSDDGDRAVVRIVNGGNFYLAVWQDGKERARFRGNWSAEHTTAPGSRFTYFLRYDGAQQTVVAVDRKSASEAVVLWIYKYRLMAHHPGLQIQPDVKAASGDNFAVSTPEFIALVNANRPKASSVFRLSDLGVTQPDPMVALEFFDSGRRLAAWTTSRSSTTTQADLLLFDVSADGTAKFVKRYEVRFPAHRFGTDSSTRQQIRLAHVGRGRFLIEQPYMRALIFDTVNGSYTQLPTPKGRSPDDFYSANYLEADNLLLASYSLFGPDYAYDMRGTPRLLGSTNASKVLPLDPGGGAYLFRALDAGPRRGTSEIRQYTPPAP